MSNESMPTNRIGKSGLLPYKSYKLSGNPGFYAAVPAPYKNYYLHFVREWLQWHDGYVGWFHGRSTDNGIFATNIASTIADKLAKKVTGGKIIFDDDGYKPTTTQTYFNKELNAIEFAKKWSDRVRLNAKATKSFRWAFAAGDSIIKLNSNDKGELSPKVARKDTYLIDCDSDGNIYKASFLIYDEKVKTPQDAQKGTETSYYVLEERRYNDNDEPEYRMSIKQGTGQEVAYKDVDFQSGDLNIKDLPDTIRKRFIKRFGVPVNDWNKWMPMSIRDIGCYMIRATEGTSFNPAIPFGESIYSNILHLLAGYDFYYSAFTTDLYLGRGKVLVPKGFEGASHKHHSDGYYQGLDELMFTQIPYVDPASQSPQNIQFDLRTDSWREVRDTLLLQIAQGIGINPRDLASFIVPAAEKPSAKEISVDEDETSLWVEDKRDLNLHRLKEMIDTVLEFYGYTDDDVEIKFSQRGLTNMNTLVNQLSVMKQNELVDDETAIDMLYPDFSEQKKKEILSNIKKKREEGRQQQMETKAIENVEEEGFVKESGNQVGKPKEETE